MNRFSAIGAALVLSLLSAAHANTVTLTVDAPDPASLAIGDVFSVTVSNSDFVQTGGATLGILWDSAVLNLDSISLAPGAFADQTPGSASAAQQLAGEIEFYSIFGDLFDPAADPLGNFDSFVLNFTAVGLGVSAISLDESQASQGWFDQVGGTIGGVVYNNTSVGVVPIPAAVWLFGSALGLMGGLRARRT